MSIQCLILETFLHSIYPKQISFKHTVVLINKLVIFSGMIQPLFSNSWSYKLSIHPSCYCLLVMDIIGLWTVEIIVLIFQTMDQ